ncbi:MAG: hypothetical protein EOO01_01935 [Chitinophagaceae bacterium]|nr:MAG: hypothetical protein EOO01_01935 [Chitinophagaceae bacterium]
MTFELTYFWEYYTALRRNIPEEINDLDPEAELENEYNRMLNNIIAYVPLKNKPDLKSYIRFQQYSLSRLIKSIELNPVMEKSHQTLTEKIAALSESLLDQVLVYFPEEFDYSQEVSLKRMLDYRIKIAAKAEKSFPQFAETALLHTIVLKSLKLEDRLRVTFEALRYNELLADFLAEKLESFSTEQALLQSLLSAGFQSPEFIKYYFQQLLAQIQSQPTLSDQYRLLTGIKREITHLPGGVLKQFEPSVKNLKAIINSFLKTEMSYVKELDFITSELINTGLLDANYKVALSVRQLAFYVYLNVESGIITEPKAKKIHEYVVSHISTTEKDEISEKSFKNAYYLHAPEDVKKIIDKLGRMLAIAQNHY